MRYKNSRSGDGIGLFRADERVFEAMRDGWRAQMLARGLATATIKANCGTVERFQRYAGTFHIGESPAEAAVREAREEIGTDVHLVELLDVLGGPDYEVQYANGDRTA